MSKILKSKADFLGVSSASLCLLHCLAIPIILSSSSLFVSIDHDVWHLLDFIFIGIGLSAIWYASQNSSSQWMKIALWTVFSIFSLSLLTHELLRFSYYISLISSILLIILHIINWKYYRICRTTRKLAKEIQSA
ncbi:MerC domain-containing protein [Penaeicola halotolerans]|uniref:MerC domain-containing protein n=1 Tax=Penaeicola halotolerans TaxID=2793196 RepID=UPI001CF81ED2|nr:MerC domain-containing protein [Penaeicola halotolerans]